MLNALSAGSLKRTDAVRVGVADGGLYFPDSQVVFTINDGCVRIGVPSHGANLGQQLLVTVPALTAGRAG